MAELGYLTGFGNEFATEAVAGALPEGRNSPQRAPFGLYAEQISGTAFTVPRDANQRTWVYRIRPSVVYEPFAPYTQNLLRNAPLAEDPPAPGPLRWDPVSFDEAQGHFVDGLRTVAVCGSQAASTGVGVHVYCATRSMDNCVFSSGDGELLIVPQEGALLLRTEMGHLKVDPNEIVVIPRGIRFSVDLPDGRARGYVCENYGATLRLPDLGPIGSNCLANARDFMYPVAAFDDAQTEYCWLMKHQGAVWSSRLGHSPLDVVAWHGNLAPYKYPLDRFNTLGTISFDHPDPSIFTVLTSQTNSPGLANMDFVIFPPRWLVGEDTFRPPWFHRNVMSEFMGLIHGQYDAKQSGFLPGGFSIHNAMVPHGPDADTFEKASQAELTPQFVGETMAFMFETSRVFQPTEYALTTLAPQSDYWQCWQGLQRHFSAP